LNPIGIKYSEMGHYASVIGGRPPAPAEARTGPLPRFERRALTVKLADGARWATAADFGKGEAAEVRARVRARFGGTVVVLDYDGDRKPDLFLAGAVVEDGQVRDLLLRNEGDGRFKDMTGEVGLDRAHPTLGCCVADFDNDGHPDLLLTGAGSVRLYRNTGENTFEDVTAEAGLDRCTAAYLGAAFVDLDHDGALDLLLCEYAATPADAVRRLRGETAVGGGRLAVYRNLGRLQQPGVLPGPARLDCCWEAAPDLAGLRELRGPVLNLASSDLRRGGAFDLLVLTDGAAPAVVVNDRLRRFHTAALPEALAPAGAWNGALVLDVNCDGRSDLLLAGPGAPPRLLLNRTRPGLRDEAQWFEAVALSAPPLIQAVAVDVDLDGWADVVGLSDRRRPVLLHNEGGRLVAVADALGSAGEWPRDLLALAALDADGRGVADLLAWSEGGGLLLYACADNGNHGLAVELACTPGLDRRTGHMVRCSADGSGAWVVAQAGEVWAGQENTTLSAGLGQSCQPLLLGLGRFRRPDVLRLRWPDGTIQAELGLPAGGLTRVERHTRRISWGGRPD
jgi:hypothetical protein